MRFVRGFLRLCALSGLLVLAGSYLGALHPLGDSLAVFRWWILGAVAAVGGVALVTRAFWTGGIAVLAAGAAAVHIASFNSMGAASAGQTPDLIVYAKNLANRWGDHAAIAQDIAAMQADVILLQELEPDALPGLQEFLPDHPYRHICHFSRWSAMAVLSRYPLSDPGCTRRRSLAYAVVDAPSGPVWVASIHQVWPYPYDQAVLLPDILDAVEAAPPRRVIAGDFNMVPWAASVRQIMAAAGARRISPVVTTIEVRGIGLPIDHVLTDGQGTATRRPRLGSDHFGMAARITWDGP